MKLLAKQFFFFFFPGLCLSLPTPVFSIPPVDSLYDGKWPLTWNTEGPYMAISSRGSWPLPLMVHCTCPFSGFFSAPSRCIGGPSSSSICVIYYAFREIDKLQDWNSPNGSFSRPFGISLRLNIEDSGSIWRQLLSDHGFAHPSNPLSTRLPQNLPPCPFVLFSLLSLFFLGFEYPPHISLSASPIGNNSPLSGSFPFPSFKLFWPFVVNPLLNDLSFIAFHRSDVFRLP